MTQETESSEDCEMRMKLSSIHRTFRNLFSARIKLRLGIQGEVKVVRSRIHHTLVSASTDDSVVGRVVRNYAHPSECAPTSYYRRNTRSPRQNAHLSRCI